MWLTFKGDCARKKNKIRRWSALTILEQFKHDKNSYYEAGSFYQLRFIVKEGLNNGSAFLCYSSEAPTATTDLLKKQLFSLDFIFTFSVEWVVGRLIAFHLCFIFIVLCKLFCLLTTRYLGGEEIFPYQRFCIPDLTSEERKKGRCALCTLSSPKLVPDTFAPWIPWRSNENS